MKFDWEAWHNEAYVFYDNRAFGANTIICVNAIRALLEPENLEEIALTPLAKAISAESLHESMATHVANHSLRQLAADGFLLTVYEKEISYQAKMPSERIQRREA